MDSILNWIKSNAGKILIFPAAIGSAEFLVNLFAAASDGVLSGEEVHRLVSIANPTQVVLIGVVMYALKRGN